MTLRILLIHERYRLPGGEDVAFEAERELLLEHGHEVETLEAHNDSIPARPSAGTKLRLAGRTVWSREAERLVGEAVRRFRADVVHAHNTFPLLSPSVFRAARREGAATVQTLHNYRLVCPSADLFRDGRSCEDCVGRSFAWPSVVHGCYRSSRAETAVVAAMLAFHRGRGTWHREVDAFVALTRFARERLARGGLPGERIHIKPNFVHPDPGVSEASRSGFVYAARLEERKGSAVLADALERAPRSVEARLAGTGPLEEALGRLAERRAGLTLLGQLERSGVLREMRGATAVVVPSLLYEGFPLTVVEAFATGTPVIASRLGGLAEVVEDGRTGILVNPGDAGALAEALGWASEHPAEMTEMGRHAREAYLTRYGGESNYERLMEIYEAAVGRRARPRTGGARSPGKSPVEEAGHAR